MQPLSRLTSRSAGTPPIPPPHATRGSTRRSTWDATTGAAESFHPPSATRPICFSSSRAISSPACGGGAAAAPVTIRPAQAGRASQSPGRVPMKLVRYSRKHEPPVLARLGVFVGPDLVADLRAGYARYLMEETDNPKGR